MFVFLFDPKPVCLYNFPALSVFYIVAPGRGTVVEGRVANIPPGDEDDSGEDGPGDDDPGDYNGEDEDDIVANDHVYNDG